MKRFVVREVETLKTTAAFYDCDCCCRDGFCTDGNIAWCCDGDTIVIIGR